MQRTSEPRVVGGRGVVVLLGRLHVGEDGVDQLPAAEDLELRVHLALRHLTGADELGTAIGTGGDLGAVGGEEDLSGRAVRRRDDEDPEDRHQDDAKVGAEDQLPAPEDRGDRLLNEREDCLFLRCHAVPQNTGSEIGIWGRFLLMYCSTRRFTLAMRLFGTNTTSFGWSATS